MLDADGGKLMNNDFKGPGNDWNGNSHRDSFDGYMDYKASGSDKGGGGSHQPSGGDGCGCVGVVVAIVVIMLIYFIFSGASWDAIDSLLGFGFLAFLFVRWLSR